MSARVPAPGAPEASKVLTKPPRAGDYDDEVIATSPGRPPGTDPRVVAPRHDDDAGPPRGDGKTWRPFQFRGLEKVSRAQAMLAERLSALMPAANGAVADGIRSRMKELFEDEVTLVLDYVHVIPPGKLKRLVADPTFLAVLAPAPQKNRGLLEIELSLAHAAIDKLLGGAGDAVGHRPLTELEDGVMSFIVLEALKTLAPNLDPGLPRMRLDTVARDVSDAREAVGDEEQLVVVQFKGTLGVQAGMIRLFLPGTLLSMVQHARGGPEWRARRVAEATANMSRLGHVKVWLRAEMARAEILGQDLHTLRTGDVVLLDEVLARPDNGQGGKLKLRLGVSRNGHIDADLVTNEGRFQAQITGFFHGAPPTNLVPTDGAQPASEPGAEPASEGAEQAQAAATSEGHVSENAEPMDLLNDIPLQIAVELGRVAITAEEVVGLKTGQVIDLNKAAGEPVELSVNGKVVARGELVEIEGHLGVRILSLSA